MKKILLLIALNILCFSSLIGQSKDTIILIISLKNYRDIAIEKLSNIYDAYNKRDLLTFSVPTFEWSLKAKEYTCESNERLENLILFKENPYFQLAFVVDAGSKVIDVLEMAISQTRTERRIKDSLDWNS